MTEYQFLLTLDSNEKRGYDYAKKAYNKNPSQETIDTLYTQSDGFDGDGYAERQFDSGISSYLQFNKLNSTYQPQWDYYE